MANRRMGGMGGGQRGNRPFSQHQPFQGSNVSPWQGNMPSNNSMNQGGLLSQLTSNPQQLALALTSLLQPQQQMSNPPSLLSLNTSPGFNQDRDFNRFGNRGRDFRRHEPYNKNRNGPGGAWRSGSGGGQQNRSRSQGGRKRSPARGDQKKDVKKEEKKSPEKKKGDADATEENNEEVNEDSKRDWKDEKNNADKKSESAEGDKQGLYTDVPVKFLNCFVCSKEMWDGESMQKHVRGRAHKQMLNSLEESIHITVNILRENMRLAEEKKVIEWNRMQRLKKYSKYQDQESHCNMCDLKFMGKIIGHRKTEGHQRLKRFLHPNCKVCGKEFPSRMEWVEHRLTPDHLRELNKALKDKTGGADGDLIIDDKEQELELEPLLHEPLQQEVDNPILELDVDLAGLQNLMPAYKMDRPVCTKSLVEFAGFRCTLCNRSFENEELSQAHLKTKMHYYQFIEAAKAKYQDNLKKEKERIAEEKAAKKAADEVKTEPQTEEAEDGDAEMYDPEEACNEEEGDSEMAAANGDVSKADGENTEEVEEEEEEEEEVKPVEEKKETKPVAASTPAKSTRASAGGVKNGAGPKSKKARKQ